MKKVVVITGASSGLGLSHAIYLTSKGYKVFGTSRNSEKISHEKLKELYIKDHTKWKFVNKETLEVAPIKQVIPKKIKANLDDIIKEIDFFTMDVASDESVKKAVSEMENKAKQINDRGIDILINNAGISYFKSAEELSMEEWKQSFEINFLGALRVIKAVLPSMKERREGRIINTGTLGAMVAIPFQSHYSASKAALKILSEGLKIELKLFNIKVSSILPSDINTSFNINMHNVTLKEQSNLKSDNTDIMLEKSLTDDTSLYSEKSKRVWRVIVKNLIQSPSPTVISKKISKIIKRRNPKVNYQAGDFMQIFLMFLIRRIVSDDFTYWLLPKYYGM